MNRKDLLIIILVLVIAFQGFILAALLIKTRVANYDIKLAHYQMETNYCPVCGEKLIKEK